MSWISNLLGRRHECKVFYDLSSYLIAEFFTGELRHTNKIGGGICFGRGGEWKRFRDL